jgi:hypothetical protein
MNFQQIKNKIQVSKSVDFGTIFNLSIELFKKTWAQGLIMMVFLMISVFVIELLFVLPITFFAAVPNFVDNSVFNKLSVLAIFLLVLFFFFIATMMIAVSNALIGGLYIIYKKADHNEPFSTNDFFMLLAKDKIGKTILIGLAQFLVILVFYMMCCLPIIYAAVPVSYIIVIYAFNQELSVTEIVKLAFVIGNKNWVETFLLRLVTSFVAMLGIFLCGIGLLVTFAIVLIPLYFVYKQVVGFDDNNEIDEIGLSDEVYTE